MSKISPFDQELLNLIPRLKRYSRVLAITNESSDDLLQSTLERALIKKHQWQEGSHLDRWLFTLMSSIWKNEIRSRVVRQGNSISNDVDNIADKYYENNRERNFLYHQVFKQVMLLPEDQREAILLVYIEGLKYQQAAKVLKIPLGTLMSRLARARMVLAKEFVDANESVNTVIQLKENLGT